MKRKTTGIDEHSKPPSRRLKRGDPEGPASELRKLPSASATTKRTDASSRMPRRARGRPGAAVGRRQNGYSAAQSAITDSSSVTHDTLELPELIQLSQTQLSSVIGLMEITSEVLRQCYAYEPGEPELWQCCNLVCDLLKQARTSLTLEGVVTHQATLLHQEWLRPSVHVIRVSLQILRGVKPNYQREVLPALRDLELGIVTTVELLDRMAQCLPHGETTGAHPLM
jgi:hypothetical protein